MADGLGRPTAEACRRVFPCCCSPSFPPPLPLPSSSTVALLVPFSFPRLTPGPPAPNTHPFPSVPEIYPFARFAHRFPFESGFRWVGAGCSPGGEGGGEGARAGEVACSDTWQPSGAALPCPLLRTPPAHTSSPPPHCTTFLAVPQPRRAQRLCRHMLNVVAGAIIVLDSHSQPEARGRLAAEWGWAITGGRAVMGACRA